MTTLPRIKFILEQSEDEQDLNEGGSNQDDESPQSNSPDASPEASPDASPRHYGSPSPSIVKIGNHL